MHRIVALLILFAPAGAFAQPFSSLKTATVPPVPNLEKYVSDRAILVVLGKALFWDMQVGSDGRTACGTCHFHAGADHRAQNQLSNPGGDLQPNRLLASNDFPFRTLSDADDNHSPVLRDSGQRVGSAGIFLRDFNGLTSSGDEQGIDSAQASPFQIGNLNLRQVTPRNAPTIINSAFHVRSFRDGRASDIFTGRTPFGDSDPRANVVAGSDGKLVPETVRLVNSSLASQAVAPPVNTVEMSYQGRSWPIVGQKLLRLRPLAAQSVANDDSVLGPHVNTCCRGLDPSYTYLSLVQSAFQPAYWDSDQLVDESGNPTKSGKFTIAEFNFSLFFGLAIQAYESSLIADDTPFDRFLEGERAALNTREVSGFLVYQTRAFCQFCHSGPELTKAGVTFAAASGPIDSVLTHKEGALQNLFSDTGFFQTGVRPANEDPGLDASDDFGVPLSLAVRKADLPLGITGAFKIPGLRNVEFTGPYFHNGGQATLDQVVDFYARGGDFPDSPFLPVEINPVPLTSDDRRDLVAFLKSLSDDRVRFERAPFDHPQICVPIGYDDAPLADPRFPFSAVDRWADIPAVGSAGNSVPLQTFEELLKGIGTDGSRAHTLGEPCRMP